MNIRTKIKNYRNIVTSALALIGIALMIFYTVCDTSCSYLKGDIFGIDLKYIGVGYMLAIIALVFFKQTALVRILLASGIGVEVYLVAFQFRKDVFCPFCLAFGAAVLLAFLLNHEKPRKRDGWRRRIIYGLGEAELPWIGKGGMPLLLFVILGYLFVILTFSGSATPAYGEERPSVPSYGKGPLGFLVSTDYFCSVLSIGGMDMEKYLNAFLSKGGVKVTFKCYDPKPIYAVLDKTIKVFKTNSNNGKYFLYQYVIC